MKLLERETKELGRSTSHDIHNTRSYTVALKYVPDIITDGRSLFSERVHTHTQERERERERERNAYRRPTLIVYELSILKKAYECPALEQLLTLTPVVIHIKIIGTTCSKIRFLNILLFHLFLMLKVKLLLAKLVIFFKNVLSSRHLLFLNSDMETLEQSGKSVQS